MKLFNQTTVFNYDLLIEYHTLTLANKPETQDKRSLILFKMAERILKDEFYPLMGTTEELILQTQYSFCPLAKQLEYSDPTPKHYSIGYGKWLQEDLSKDTAKILNENPQLTPKEAEQRAKEMFGKPKIPQEQRSKEAAKLYRHAIFLGNSQGFEKIVRLRSINYAMLATDRILLNPELDEKYKAEEAYEKDYLYILIDRIIASHKLPNPKHRAMACWIEEIIKKSEPNFLESNDDKLLKLKNLHTQLSTPDKKTSSNQPDANIKFLC